jgi:carboxyl-terminal processing protease
MRFESHRPATSIAAAVLLAVLATALPVAAAPADPMPPAPPGQWRHEAEAFERQGRWDRAGEAYLKLLGLDRNQPAVRERLVLCLRHVQLARRHADPAYRQQVAQLPLPRALALYGEAAGKLGQHYVDRDRATPARLVRRGVEELSLALTDETFRRAHLSGAAPETLLAYAAHLRQTWAERTVRDAAEARQAVRGLALAAEREVGLNPSVAVMECLCGACNGLDEYSAYLLPGQPGEGDATVADELTVAGLVLGVRGEQVVVERVVPGSWADSVYVREGERVLRAGRPLPTRATPEDVARALRAEANGPVRLVLADPDGGLPRTLDIPTGLPTAVGTHLIDQPRGVGYTRLVSFRRNTLRDLDDAVLTLRMQGARALVLDLRGNPGGLFSVALQLAERFLPEGAIVSAQGSGPGATRTYASQGGMAASDLPLVLLVDGETASAAEVVAGAFKDHGRATVVGVPTFGKGSVQGVLDLAGPGGLRLTLARLFTPRGLPLSQGVVPHVSEPVEKNQILAAVDVAARLAAMRP